MGRITLAQIVAMEEAEEREEMDRAEREAHERHWDAIERRVPAPRQVTSDGVEFETVWFPHRDALALLQPRSEQSSIAEL